jgi:hypothetical protein
MILPTLTHLTGGTGLSKITQNSDIIDLSNHNTVFCDSIQALDWAYSKGLPKTAIIKSSSPAMLWSKDHNIYNVEKRWTEERLGEFQNSIQKFSETIFDVALNTRGIEREFALTVSRSAVTFQRVIYKAACLEEGDFIEPRLFIKVSGEGGPAGNNMNSPWERLLFSNSYCTTVEYILQKDEWRTLDTIGVSRWKRYRIAGIETLVYRSLVRVLKKIPTRLFKKEVFVFNENELILDIAATLMLKGVKISEINLDAMDKKVTPNMNQSHIDLYRSIVPIMQERIEQWVVKSSIEPTLLLFREYIKKQVYIFEQMTKQWEKIIPKNYNTKKVVLMNAPSTIKAQALSYVCRKKSIPSIAVQHGVTVEISKLHGELSSGFDNSNSDAVLCYNSKFKDVMSKSYFAKSKIHIVGISSRHLRVNSASRRFNNSVPIVYISTTHYRGNIGSFVSSKTDYANAKVVGKIVSKVLGELPYKVCYKTYPEDNRRYADIDPVIKDVEMENNIELFSKKVDMRYLLSEYRVIVTTIATSTLSWAVMSGKPVVFINQSGNGPLTKDAYKKLSEGIFVFNDSDKNFHGKLRDFLSQPIKDIERLWKDKASARREMIKIYFSDNNGGAGTKAAKIILREYLN